MKIAIVGGGTAGWMAACYSLNEWPSRAIESNILDAAEKYFKERESELNKKSLNELPYAQWLEKNVFRINQNVE